VNGILFKEGSSCCLAVDFAWRRSVDILITRREEPGEWNRKRENCASWRIYWANLANLANETLFYEPVIPKHSSSFAQFFRNRSRSNTCSNPLSTSFEAKHLRGHPSPASPTLSRISPLNCTELKVIKCNIIKALVMLCKAPLLSSPRIASHSSLFPQSSSHRSIYPISHEKMSLSVRTSILRRTTDARAPQNSAPGVAYCL
jgi:hypothetical protein